MKTIKKINHLVAFVMIGSAFIFTVSCKKTNTSVPVGLASLTTAGISAIVTNSAKSGGTITADGGAAVTARGVCWSTSSNPTVSDSKTSDGTGSGSFTSLLTSLTANTTYNVRAYATNSAGTAYGNTVSFTTSVAPAVPILTTSAVTNITATTASSGGNITSDGGATITARGACWSTSANPTTSDSKTSDGTGSGSFTSSLTGLNANTTYNVRAYATNSVGTAYGNAVSFTTANPTSKSPWQVKANGESASQRGIYGMSAADSINCYGVIYDAGNYFGDPLHDITFTHDGGATWQTQTIPGLANNMIVGVSATSASTVHVIAVNSTTFKGGNVFRSTDGGTTWQREAANAFTDAAASFPDNIKFFDSQNGVIFGDPENGYFEIYTTSDGGNSWSRVPSNKIPASLPNEEGLSFIADIFNNSIWVITVTVGNNNNFISGRLLQSDDKGQTWYVKNSSLTFTGSDGDIKFRNASVGLYKNSGNLYRTTDGGTTWSKVNYSGTWFSYDFAYVPGKDGYWISTGGDANFPTNSLKGFGSSISSDDGNSWVTLDTLVNHTLFS